MKSMAILLIVVIISVPTISWADDYFWNDPAGGELGDSTKWNPPLTPGIDDYVYFNLPNSYTIWLDSDYTHDRITVDGSNLTLDLKGHIYFLDGLADYSRAAIIGDTTDGSLTAFGGGIRSGDIFFGWNSSFSTGRLNLSGAGTFLSGYINDGWHGFFYGNSGNADVTVTDNAYLEHGHGQSGCTGSALFDVNGIDTEWFVSGYFGMSIWGKTTMSLRNGARSRYGFLEMAVFPGSSAIINITGQSRNTELAIENGWWDPVSLFIGREGKGTINLTGSALYHTGNTVIGQYLYGQGELNILEGSRAELQGSVAVGGSLNKRGGQGLIYIYDDPYNGEPSELICTGEEGQSLVIWPEGTIRMDGGNIWMEYDSDLANPIDLKGGKLEGWGSIWAEVNNESGVVVPGTTGNNWKALELKYNYIQGTDGTLKIGIRGPNGYWDYGGLVVTASGQGEITLNGILDVDLRGGYVPNYDDVFLIVQGNSISGKFKNAPSQVVFEDGTFEVIYGAEEISLTHFTAEPKCIKYPASDLNKDCLVDFVDLAILASQWLDCNLDPPTTCW